jgi:recombination protein RecT
MTTSHQNVARADEKPTLATLIRRMEPEIAKALPSHMNPTRMARIASTVLKQTPALARCTPESFLGALLTASQLGLEPGPTGDAYLVPFGNVCTFVPGYRGLIRLARNSGQLRDIWAEVVYANDTFKYTLGLHRDLIHEPAIGDRGKPTHVYAAAELTDGGRPFVVMTAAEVEAIRGRSRAGKSGPWVTDWSAMAKKTAIKQLAKWLPLSAELSAAVNLDGSVRTDIASSIADVAPTFVEGEVVEDAGELTTGTQPTPDADVVLEAAQ